MAITCVTCMSRIHAAHWMNAIVCIDPMGIMREKFSLMFWPMHSLWPAQPMREIFSLALQGNSLQYDEITWIFKSDHTLLTSNRKGHRDKLVAKNQCIGHYSLQLIFKHFDFSVFDADRWWFHNLALLLNFRPLCSPAQILRW